MLFLAPLNTSHSTHASPRTSPPFSPPDALATSYTPWASSVHSHFRFQAAHPRSASSRPQLQEPRPQIRTVEFHSQGGISMTTTTSGESARTRPIDHASANYDIALNLAANTGTVRQELCFHTRRMEIRSRHTRTAAVAASAAGPLPTSSASYAELARPMAAHYGRPPRLPSYRDNHAPRRAMFGTSRHNTLRGPPGISRKPRGAQRDASERRDVDQEIPPACRCRVNARPRRRLTRKQTEKNKEKGTGGLTANLSPPVPRTRDSLEALFITAYQKDN